MQTWVLVNIAAEMVRGMVWLLIGTSCPNKGMRVSESLLCFQQKSGRRIFRRTKKRTAGAECGLASTVTGQAKIAWSHTETMSVRTSIGLITKGISHAAIAVLFIAIVLALG